MAARSPARRGLRLLFVWLFTALVVGVYFALPDAEEVLPPQSAADNAGEQAAERRIEITAVSPQDPTLGGAVTVSYMGASDDAVVGVFVGKTSMEVLARRRGSVVARVPNDFAPGRVKLRVTDGENQRSKPYDVRIKPANWRKPFRNLIGGFALLIFGISVLARGAREAAGLRGAQALARVAGRGPAALGLGAAVGAVAQSTTAAAGLIAGLVASSLLAVGPAAVAFLGAQLGAVTAPLLTGLIDPREGLLVVAIGVLWLAFANDRRSIAFSRLILGAGLIAFGLQTLRPGFEPFVQEPSLLALVAKLNARSVLDLALCAGLGAALVALLQGPAPVVVLVLVLAQTTAQWDLRTALAVLSGSGLGAALGALLTTPAARRSQRLAGLNLILGLASTILAVSTVGVWSRVADWLVPGVPHEISWGKRILLPNLGLHLGVAFALSQVASALALFPFAPWLAGWLERRFPDVPARELAQVGDPVGVVRARLLGVLTVQLDALTAVRDLVHEGSRTAGRLVEHRLGDARAELDDLLSGVVPALPAGAAGRDLGRAALTALQLQRSLETLLRQAERLLDTRVAVSATGAVIVPLPSADAEALTEMHELLTAGLTDVRTAIAEQVAVDFEHSCAREISMNSLEARARGLLSETQGAHSDIRLHLRVLELVDAYEAAGNQSYRLAEALGQSSVETSVVRAG